MGKTYIDTVKYVIYADYEIDGIVEKPDLIGAIFGQTEGLLGQGLDLRELQKSGRIGRIEVSTNTKDGGTSGVIQIPSSLDSVKTSVLAAGLEAVDRIGPCEGKITVTKIEDTRTNKRDVVVSRAQEILKKMMSGMGVDSREISDKVLEQSKTADVILYSPEKISAGPDIYGKELIIVEGRADVLTLLKSDIKNVIALQGKKIPKCVIELARKKENTIFIDGDRGGELIIKQLATVMKISYIAKAPDGKEVEELTQKEILKCLKKRMTYPEHMKKYHSKPNTWPKDFEKGGPSVMKAHAEQTSVTPYQRPVRRTERAPMKRTYVKKVVPYETDIKKLEGSLTATIVDEKGKKTEKVEVKNLTKEIEKMKDPSVVIFDGVITQRLVDLAQKKKIKEIVGIKKGKINSTGDVKVYTLY